MDTSNNRPSEPGHNGEQPPRRTGGLLSNYGRQSQPQQSPQSQSTPQPHAQQFSPSLPHGGLGGKRPTSSLLGGNGGGSRSGLLSQQRNQQQSSGGTVGNSPSPLPSTPSSAPTGGLLRGRNSNFMANATQWVRSWSGKLTAVSSKLAEAAGYQVEPPAPPMQRIRPSAFPPSSPGGEMATPQRSQPWKRSRTLRITMQMKRRQSRWQRGNRWLPNLLTAMVIVMLITSFGGATYGIAYYQSQLPRLDSVANFSMPQTTRIYDRNGKLLYESTGEKESRMAVSYNDIPKVMLDAMIAVEDSTFWENSGIDPIGIARAFVGLVQSGSIQGGGSTITQQVIKNITDEKEQTPDRKISEAALAIGLTQQYPKWKILEMYFNVAPFSSYTKGIEAAAQMYFNIKSSCDFSNVEDQNKGNCIPAISRIDLNAKGEKDPYLALARASLLAGLPQSPSAYDPTTGEEAKERALNRQVIVLQRMIDQNVEVEGIGKITPEVVKKVKEMTAEMEFKRPISVKHAPHFVDWIILQVQTALGNGDPDAGILPFLEGGFHIRTTASLELQEYLEKAVVRHLTEIPLYQKDGIPMVDPAHNVNTNATVVMNAKTGEILAMNGSRDYYDPDIRVGGQFNSADAGRPPGSSFKPFVYATAFEMGWYPGLTLPDYRTHIPTSGQGAGAPAALEGCSNDSTMYAPPDYNAEGACDKNNNRDSTLRYALAESQNVTAVKAMKYAGLENVKNFVHRLGLTQYDSTSIASSLGTEDATVLQMTGAYQAFANGGVRIPPKGVLDIWDNYGNHLYHYDPANPTDAVRAMSEQIAFLTTAVMLDEKARYLEFFDIHALSFHDVDANCVYSVEACSAHVAAKTGTTDFFKDLWTVGYTPNVVVGSWSGNANNEEAYNVLGIAASGNIWHSVIATASGFCYYAQRDDGLECPHEPGQEDAFLKSIGVDNVRTFSPPTGVVQATVSNIDGLLGGGTTDYIIDGMQPTLSGQPATGTLAPNAYKLQHQASQGNQKPEPEPKPKPKPESEPS